MADLTQLVQDLGAHTGVVWTPRLNALALRLDTPTGWMSVVAETTLGQLLDDWDACTQAPADALRTRLARSDAGYPVTRPVWDGVCQVLGVERGTAFRAARPDELVGDPTVWWDRGVAQTLRTPDRGGAADGAAARWHGIDGAAAAWAFAAAASHHQPVVVALPLHEYGTVLLDVPDPVALARGIRQHSDPDSGLLADPLLLDHGTVIRVWHALDAA